MKIEISEEERQALLTVIGTLERKAAKGEFWKGRMAPLLGFIDRLKQAKEEGQ